MLPEIRLKVRVQGRHPLFFRKMIRKPDRTLPAGGPVHVRDKDGKPVGTGFYNPRTDLALRMIDRKRLEDVGAHLVAAVGDACDLRDRRLRLPEVTTGYRLVHAEGDGIPGLVIDRLGDAIVAQVYALGILDYMEAIGGFLVERYPGSRMVLTVDSDAALREGIPKQPRPREFTTEVVEHGLRYAVRPGSGHKTGFFADQRNSRQRVKWFAKDRRVLDLFCNSGGFAMAAAQGGARDVVAVDLDEAMVADAAANAKANRLDVDLKHGDAFDWLRDIEPGAFDLLVLDPPKWVRGKDELTTGIDKYRDLNRLALKKLPRGGILVTNSCSGAVTPPRFHAILAEAASRAGRDARILYAGGAGPDHPVALECPETRYLETVILELR